MHVITHKIVALVNSQLVIGRIKLSGKQTYQMFFLQEKFAVL
jgi:hypothetical protein